MSFHDNISEYHSSNTGYDYDVYSNSDVPKNLDFSLDEIREQLNKLGFSQIPDEKLLEIKRDLDEIIVKDESLKGAVAFPKLHNDGDWFVSTDDGDNDDSSFATVTSLSQGDPHKMKRKVSRKNGSKKDNYLSESSLSTPRPNYNSATKHFNLPNEGDYFRKVSFPQDPVDDIFNYTGVSLGPNDLEKGQDRSHRPENKTSFIRMPNFNNVDRGWYKHDPVTRYHSYKASWEQTKAPGESPHKELRWAVKAAMMVREVPQPRIQRPKSARQSNANHNSSDTAPESGPVGSFSNKTKYLC